MKLNGGLVIGILILFFIAGCLNLIRGSEDYTSQYVDDMAYVPAYGPTEVCKVGYCECFGCQNRSWLFGLRRSFEGGNCKFFAPCDEDTYNSLLKQEDGADTYSMRFFMLGTGPSFADFGDANTYCNTQLTMAVHWLTGNENKTYDLPSAKRAMCMLRMGVMPVYVLYSNSEDVNSSRAGEIAKILGYDAHDITMGLLEGPVGPVIVTTEMKYNASKPGVVDDVVDQIILINENCQNDYSNPDQPKINCFVALAPKMGDTAAVDAVMNHPRLPPGRVHMMAFGIDSHDDETGACSGSRMILDAANFARFGLYNHSLPSVIPYVLFDADAPINPESCWYSENVDKAYGSFFPHGVNDLLGAGVIGVSAYDFNTSTSGGDPLKCHDCAIGRTDARIDAWYGGCQAFTAVQLERPSAGRPIIFPNESGGYCDYGLQEDTLFFMFGGTGNREFFETPTHKLDESAVGEAPFRCDACLTDAVNITDIYTIFKYWKDEAVLGEDKKEIFCTAFPEIDYYASKNNVDPMFVRAAVWRESSFNTCGVAMLCRPGEFHTTTGTYYDPITREYREDTFKCIVPEGSGGYEKGFDIIYDPDGNCLVVESSTDPPQFRFRGMGLFQTLIPPYTYWPAEYREDGEENEDLADMYREAKAAGAAINVTDKVKSCSEQFNPFNSTHAACLGTIKFYNDLKKAETWVDSHNTACSGHGNILGIRDKPEKREIMVGFIGFYINSGVWLDKTENQDECPGVSPGECWFNGYCALKQAKADCSERLPDGSCRFGCEEKGGVCVPDPIAHPCLERDVTFIDYVSCRIANDYNGGADEPQNGGTDDRYGIFKKMGYYIYLNEECDNSFCPAWKKVVDVAEIDIKDPKQVNENFDPVNDPYGYLRP